MIFGKYFRSYLKQHKRIIRNIYVTYQYKWMDTSIFKEKFKYSYGNSYSNYVDKVV